MPEESWIGLLKLITRLIRTNVSKISSQLLKYFKPRPPNHEYQRILALKAYGALGKNGREFVACIVNNPVLERYLNRNGSLERRVQESLWLSKEEIFKLRFPQPMIISFDTHDEPLTESQLNKYFETVIDILKELKEKHIWGDVVYLMKLPESINLSHDLIKEMLINHVNAVNKLSIDTIGHPNHHNLKIMRAVVDSVESSQPHPDSVGLSVGLDECDRTCARNNINEIREILGFKNTTASVGLSVDFDEFDGTYNRHDINKFREIVALGFDNPIMGQNQRNVNAQSGNKEIILMDYFKRQLLLSRKDAFESEFFVLSHDLKVIATIKTLKRMAIKNGFGTPFVPVVYHSAAKGLMHHLVNQDKSFIGVIIWNMLDYLFIPIMQSYSFAIYCPVLLKREDLNLHK